MTQQNKVPSFPRELAQEIFDKKMLAAKEKLKDGDASK